MRAEERAEQFRAIHADLMREIGRTVVGHTEIVQGPLAEECGLMLKAFFERLRRDARTDT